MGMYRALLSAAFNEPGGPECLGPAELLHRLIVLRDDCEDHAGVPLTDALAANVAYDRVLIEVCRCNGIECGIEGFESPIRERRRLEHKLAKSGVRIRT